MRVATIFVPILVIAVFFHQLVYMYKYDLSPWKGGGFGMFSTLDSPSRRLVNMEVRFEGEVYKTAFPSSFYREQKIWTSLPKSSVLESVFDELGEKNWIGQKKPGRFNIFKDIEFIDQVDHLPSDWIYFSPESISFQFWKYRYDSKLNSLTAKIVINEKREYRNPFAWEKKHIKQMAE